jgi:hypothetical protein
MRREWIGWIHENRDSREPRQDVLEQLQLLAVDPPPDGDGEPRDAPARPSEAGHQARAYGIDSQEHDDGDRPGRVLGRYHRRRGSRNNDINPETHELGREVRKTIDVAVRKAIVDDDVLALDPAQVAQPALECVGHTLRRVARGNGEVADSVHPPHRLGLGGKRRGEEAERDAGDECPPIHYSIT